MRALRIVIAALLATAVACTGGGPGSGGASGPPRPLALMAWASEPLPEAAVERAKALEGVGAVGVISSTTLDLEEAGGAAKPPDAPAGAILPVSVAFVDPAPLAAAGSLPEIVPTLQANRAAFTRAAAEFRGIETGAVIRLAGPGGTAAIRVGAIVEEEPLLRSEILLPAGLASRLGAPGADTVVLAVQPDAWAPAVKGLRDLLAGVPVRLRAVDGPDNSAPLLSLGRVKQRFGEFWYRPGPGSRIHIDEAWVDEHIVETTVPLLGTVKCNKAIIPQLTWAMEDLQAQGLGGLVRSYNGCWSPRSQYANDFALSRHSWGIAVDVNADGNRYGETPTLDPRLVETMERWGFSWGGRWLVPDGMHFEWVREVRATRTSP